MLPKATGTRISCTATAMKANIHEILIINFANGLTHAGLVSVIPVPLVSSVICVVAQSWKQARPDVDGA